MTSSIPHLGEILSLLTAAVWAFAIILFKKSGEAVHPIGLNLFKNLLATTLLVPTVFLFGESLLIAIPAREYLLVFASGALGIGIGDSLLFMSLNRLGAGRSAIVSCLYSPMVIALSMLWLHEKLAALQIVGAGMIVTAVLMLPMENRTASPGKHRAVAGVIIGVLAVVAMAGGVVIAKPLLDRCPLLWVTQMRLLGGVMVLLMVLALHPARRRIVTSIASSKRWGYTLSGSFVGAYLAMILWLAGIKFTQASIASALNQTSNVFIFILAALLLREPITRFRLTGIILGFSGAVLVTFG